MNIVLTIDDFIIENIHFLETKDNIIMDGNFTKLIYSDPYIIMNGIYIYCPIELTKINKNIAYYEVQPNIEIISKILEIENKILQYYKKIYSLKEDEEREKKELREISINKQLFTGTLKLNSFSPIINGYTEFNNKGHLILKLSGVWENNNNIGITYKFLQQA